MHLLSSRADTSWTDEALLLGMVADNRSAFTELYERYWYRVFAVAYRQLKSREVAEELVQDLFAALWHKRAERTIGHLEHYLMAAIAKRVLGYLRAYQVRAAYADDCRWHTAIFTHETEHTLAANDLTEALKTALNHLPRQSQEIFQLNRLEHQSVSEIAKQLCMSTKAVEYHITKSLRLLRAHLKEFRFT